MTRARRGVALALLLFTGLLIRPPSAAAAPDRWLAAFDVEHASFEDLLALPNVRRLAHEGGAGLMTLDSRTSFDVRTVWQTLAPNAGGARLIVPVAGPRRSVALEAADREIGRVIRAVSNGSRLVTVLIVSTTSSAGMVGAGDELHPIVFASGRHLLASGGPARALTSDSTRRVGVVTELDLAATIAAIFGGRYPGADDGEPIRIVDRPAPFDLHARYLAMRRMTVPVQTAAGLYVTLAGLFGVGVLAMRRRVGVRLARAGAWLAMSVPALAVGLLAAGHLRTLSYATVVPFVVAVTAVGTAAFAPLARRDLLLAPAAIGWAVLAYFLLEAAVGWTAALTPFLGGSELDGGRFFGLPNAFIGLLVGASLFAAARLSRLAGTILVVLVAFLAGLPFAGANLGGSITLFAAAGLWWAIRPGGRFDLRGLLGAAGVVVVGTAIVLLSHRYLTSAPTHITRFEETTGRSLSGIWRTFVDRTLVGWRLILSNPFAAIPVVGLGVALLAVVRPPAPVRESLRRHPAWRDALLVTLLAGVVAIPVNDSWPAALGLAFGLGLGGLLYVSLSDPAGMMGVE